MICCGGSLRSDAHTPVFGSVLGAPCAHLARRDSVDDSLWELGDGPGHRQSSCGPCISSHGAPCCRSWTYGASPPTCSQLVAPHLRRKWESTSCARTLLPAHAACVDGNRVSQAVLTDTPVSHAMVVEEPARRAMERTGNSLRARRHESVQLWRGAQTRNDCDGMAILCNATTDAGTGPVPASAGRPPAPSSPPTRPYSSSSPSSAVARNALVCRREREAGAGVWLNVPLVLTRLCTAVARVTRPREERPRGRTAAQKT